jgi:hypothetical protein
MGALAILFAFYAFRPAAFSYVFTGGGARFWFTLENVIRLVTAPANGPTVIATLVAMVLYVGVRRSRYFGNTVPLLMTLLLMPLMTTQTVTAPWLWALPFLFTFLGGVFADALETRQRRMFLALTGVLLVAQAALCVMVLPVIAR